MFIKILITLLVIIIAAIVLRQRKLVQQALQKPVVIQVQEEPSDHQIMMKWISIVIVLFLVLSVGSYYVVKWNEDHQLYNIRIVNPQTGKEESYQAYKKDLRGSSFVTLTGLQVTVSEFERVEMEAAD